MKTVDGIVEMEEKQAAESKLVAFESAWGEISWKAEVGWTMSRQPGILKYSIPAAGQHSDISTVSPRDVSSIPEPSVFVPCLEYR